MTAHLMDGELDAGDIVLQRAVPVGPRDTTTDLFHKTLDLIAPITVESLALIESGKTDFTPQDRSRASFFHKRADEDSRIDWTWSAAELDRLVRLSAIRTRARSPITTVADCGSSALGSPPAVTAAPPVGSSTGRTTAW